MEKDLMITRVIDSFTREIRTAIISVDLPNDLCFELLFLPKMANIGFLRVDNTVLINLKNAEFRDFYNDWSNHFVARINAMQSLNMQVSKFNDEIKALILFGRRENEMSEKQAKGLFAELFVLRSKLMKAERTLSDILDGWHRPSPANHDFDFGDYSLEVKAISKASTSISISSEYQLCPCDDKPLFLHVIRIDTVLAGNTDSLSLIYNDIIEILGEDLSRIFVMKCASDYFGSYLGPALMPLQFKFTIIEEEIFTVNHDEFPRIKIQDLSTGISNVSYRIDISSLSNFKNS
jgi:hypothetical protein